MKRALGLLVSAGLLLVLYWQTDWRELATIWAQTRQPLLVAALLMFLPLALLTGYRFVRIAGERSPIGWRQSTELVFASSALNMVLPAKMGDMAKALFLTTDGRTGLASALALVTFEKVLDMLALLLWGVLGLALLSGAVSAWWPALLMLVAMLLNLLALLLIPAYTQLAFRLVRAVLPMKIKPKLDKLTEAWGVMQALVFQQPRRVAGWFALSLLLWALHLGQIWLFTAAMGAGLPFGAAFGLVPLAIIAGLVPVTFAGIGTRDAAFVVVLAGYMTQTSAVVLGVLCTLRYVMPALVGLPYLAKYIALVRKPA